MAKKVTAEPPGRASPAVHLNLPREPGASFPGGAGFFMPHDGLARSLEGARCCARRRHAVLALLADGDTDRDFSDCTRNRVRMRTHPV